MREPRFVVTCEHAGNRVPAAYATPFAGHADLLTSHRGWDPGAAELARDLARTLGAPLHATTTTRLLVDTNRSLHHRRLFSEVTRQLPAPLRDRIVARWWRPLRDATRRSVESSPGPVVHLSAHSFTPVLDGHAREIDVAFLYDPARARERALVAAWWAALRTARPDLRIRRNAPYRGRADGHTSALRRLYPDARYAGIEIEVNQALTTGPPTPWRALRRTLCRVIATTAPP